MQTEILAQPESTGILYEPYRDAFKQCIYEEAGVQGKNERYEFRCDTSLECCGRVCCIPEETLYLGMPLWLLLLFIALALLLLLALLYLLYYLCCRKRKQKKAPVPFVPSQMEEKLLAEPRPLRVVAQEIACSRQSLATSADVVVPEPQRAQHAYYRPFVPDKMEELEMPVPQHLSISTRDITDMMGSSQLPAYSTLEKPMKSAASIMYLRPGYENVPSY